jgi:TrmH family RNA methyltransferase
MNVRVFVFALENIRIILVETSHPGNVGAAARAMKTMGLKELYLVNPKDYPCVEATARAAGADDVLATASTVNSLPEALVGCQWVLGTSARLRTLRWPILTAREAAEQSATLSADTRVAVVFGRERTGLTNEEMSLCQSLVNIPVNPEYSSLNIAAAVQVIAYEMRVAILGNQTAQDGKPAEEYAPAEMLESFHQQLEHNLVAIDYMDPNNHRQLPLKLRRLFSKARPTVNEMKILRGILKAFYDHKMQ